MTFFGCSFVFRTRFSCGQVDMAFVKALGQLKIVLVLLISEFSYNRPRGYKTFFMLNSTEHEISTAYKN